MADDAAFDILMVGQAGRVGYEALLCVASLRAYFPGFLGRLVVAEPQPGRLWSKDPRLGPELREALEDLGAEIAPFDTQHFGETYPIGNKIEALQVLAPDRPFLFLDSDMLVTAPIVLNPRRPAASRRVRNTWPKPPLYGPTRGDIWRSLYRRFDLDIAPSLDPAFPPDHWRHYLYRNAGWFCGPCGPTFGRVFTDYARTIRDDPPEDLACQSLDPWLDQVALPLVLTRLGGGPDGPDLDQGPLTHYRVPALLYATAPDDVITKLETLVAPNKLKKHLKQHKPFHRAFYRGEGAKARALIDRNRLPASEALLRNRLRQAGLWCR